MGEKVTAGRDFLSDIAPKFAELNDDVLFGEVWSREDKLSARDRSLITVAGLMASGILDTSLKFHLKKALENGLTREELAEAVTHLGFYVGWPKAWAVFNMIKEIYKEEGTADPVSSLFGKGEYNEAYAEYFNGKTYLKELAAPTDTSKVAIYNVVFEPGVINNWHSHSNGQILMVTDGYGWYQEDGKEAVKLKPGDVVNVPKDVKHWHGAAKDSWFTHIAQSDGGTTEWYGRLSDEEYGQLPKVADVK
jgi:4-carboxymuconolactone decarboxylase